MLQEDAERKVKAVQKEFLMRVEEHPIFHLMEPDDFNDLRKRVFRGTFAAFRLGVIGLEKRPTKLYSYFFGWLENHRVMQSLDANARNEVTEMCFAAALESYRLGAMAAQERQ